MTHPLPPCLADRVFLHPLGRLRGRLSPRRINAPAPEQSPGRLRDRSARLASILAPAWPWRWRLAGKWRTERYRHTVPPVEEGSLEWSVALSLQPLEPVRSESRATSRARHPQCCRPSPPCLVQGLTPVRRRHPRCKSRTLSRVRLPAVASAGPGAA